MNQLKFAGDFVIINVSFALGFLLKFGTLSTYFEYNYLAFHLFFNLAWIGCAYFTKSYQRAAPSGNIKTIGRLFQLLILHLLFVIAFNGLIKTYYSRQFLLYTYGVIIILIPIWRLLFTRILSLYRKGGFNNKNVLVVGNNQDLVELKNYFRTRPEQGYVVAEELIKKITENEADFVQRIMASASSKEIDEIYCPINMLSASALHSLVVFAENNLLRIRLVPETAGMPFKKMKVEFYDHVPVLAFRPFALDDPLNRAFKRIFDFVFSLLVVVFVLSWLLPILALIIKLDSKGPVFFSQKRSGKNGESFNCLKLRSMKINSESDSKQAIEGDQRITSIGSTLRKLNLDELPQFINVLLGDMSVVGPRPHMELHTKEYSKSIDRYMLRHHIKPGVTGLSQVLGYRGETRDDRSMRNRIKVDVFYMENWTFLLDVKVVFLTIWNMLTGKDSGS